MTKQISRRFPGTAFHLVLLIAGLLIVLGMSTACSEDITGGDNSAFCACGGDSGGKGGNSRSGGNRGGNDGGSGSGGDGGGNEGGNRSGGHRSGDEGGARTGGTTDGSRGGGPQGAESVADELVQVIHQQVDVYDNSGNILGVGELSVYQPHTVRLKDSFAVRLRLLVPVTSSDSTLGEQTAVPTSFFDTTGTPSFLGTVIVHEVMGAELRGIDTNLFEIESSPKQGINVVERGVPIFWEWSLRTENSKALGIRKMMIALYLPRTLLDGTVVNQNVAEIPVTFEIVPEVAPSTPTKVPTTPNVVMRQAIATDKESTTADRPAPSELLTGAAGLASSVVVIATAVTSVGAAAALIWRGYRLLESRNKEKERKEKSKRSQDQLQKDEEILEKSQVGSHIRQRRKHSANTKNTTH